ncbi:MAG: molybdenum cofactor biosynthesis protein MoaE [Tepidamorphaceae bacterium]
MATVRVQAEPFDAATEVREITRGRPDIGAVVTFTGLCRDEGGTLAALELEHYPGMAEAEIARVAAEAEARWPITGLTAIHRFGKITPGDDIVLVVAASAHRAAAFEAAEFLMDFLKTRAPFWKKEHRLDGTAGDWVEAKDADDAATVRWRKDG